MASPSTSIRVGRELYDAIDALAGHCLARSRIPFPRRRRGRLTLSEVTEHVLTMGVVQLRDELGIHDDPRLQHLRTTPED